MKKFISLLLSVVLCLSLMAPAVAYARSPKLNKSKLELRSGDTYSLKLNGVSGGITWTSSKKSVATVSSKGKVTAKKEGKATITATANNKKYKCSVTVLSNKTTDILLGIFNFDELPIEEYLEQYKKDYPYYLDVKVYDDEYLVATMHETDRLLTIKEFKNNIDSTISSILSEDLYKDVFTEVEVDELYQNVKISANKKKYDKTLTPVSSVVTFGIISDTIQGLNLISPDKRQFNLIIVDNSNGDVLYTTEE